MVPSDLLKKQMVPLKQGRMRKVDFQNLSEASEYVVQSSYIRQKFNLLWDDSETSNISANWKHEDWFGWFTDEAYPWIYHVDLGLAILEQQFAKQYLALL